MVKKYVIIAGNFTDGFEVIGPFSSFKKAHEYAYAMNEVTWITELRAPEK